MEGNKSTESLMDQAKTLVGLYIENLRYTLAEKLTVLLAGFALCGIAVLIVMAVLIFIGIFIAGLLSSMMASWLSFLIVAVFYALLLVLVFFLRKPLIENPVARFISRIMIDPPTSGKK